MAVDDLKAKLAAVECDARSFDEYTPLPELGPTVSPQAADLAIALATCAQLKAAMAVMQARNDQLIADRRVLAERIRYLEKEKK